MTGMMDNKYYRAAMFVLTGFTLAIGLLFVGGTETFGIMGRDAYTLQFFIAAFLLLSAIIAAVSGSKFGGQIFRAISIFVLPLLIIAPFIVFVADISPFLQGAPFTRHTPYFLLALLIIALPISAIAANVHHSLALFPERLHRDLAWVCIGAIGGAMFVYIAGYIAAFAVLLTGFVITRIVSIRPASLPVKEPRSQKSTTLVILTTLAGAGVGVAVIHNLRAYAMFQTSQPLSYSTALATFFIFMLIGLFFCRTNFSGGYPLLNLVRRLFGRKPDETKLPPTVYMSFSFVLIALGILFAASSYEFLGILGNKVPELLPRNSAFSIVFLVFLKAAFIWGPFAIALPAFLTSAAAAGARFANFFFLGTGIGVLLSILTLSYGIVGGIYFAAFVVAHAGFIALLKSRKFFSPPMLFRMVIVTAVAAIVLSSLTPNTTLAQRMLFFIKSGIDIRYTSEGKLSTLTVAQFDNEDKDRARTELYENSMYLGGISAEDRYVRLAGYMPKFYGKNYTTGTVLGYNTGIAANALFKVGLKSMTVVEKNSDKLNLQEYFSGGNELVLNNPAVTTVIMDPAKLEHIEQNVVIFEPGLYTFAGGWELYRTSYLEKICSSLSSDGMVIVPMTGLSAESFEEVAGSFAAAFAEVHVYYYRLGTILVCFKQADTKLDMNSIRNFIQQESGMFAGINVFSPYDIAAGFVCVWDKQRPSGLSRPEVPYTEELALTSISARQSKQIELLASKRAIPENFEQILKGDFDQSAMVRFRNSGGEVLGGIAQFLSSADVDAPKRAAEAFRNAVEMNQGDYEAKWFLNYLVKVGSITLDNPKEENKLDKLIKTILTGTDNEERLRTLRKLIEFADTMENKDIADLAKLINDTDVGVRRQLAVLLGYFRDDLSRTTVLRLIGDPDNIVVTAAINSAVAQNNVGAIPQLLDKLDDPELLGPVVSAFKKFGSSRAAPRLAEQLAKADDKGMVFILAALANCGTPAEYGAIRTCLSQSSQQVRESSLLALRKIAQRSGDNSAKAIFESALADADVYVRLQAVLGLGETGTSADFAKLKDMFIENPASESEVLLDGEILTAIGRCGGAEAKDFLLSKFDYPEINISSAAIAALGFTKAEGIEEILIATARNGTLDARLAAIDGLYNLGPELAARLIPTLVEDENRSVRQAAIQHLAAIRSDEGRSIFRKLFDNSNLDVVADAARVAYTSGDASFTSLLFPLINSGNELLAAAACESIVRLADTVILGRYCREALNHPTERVRMAAAAALAYLPTELPKDYPVSVLVENLSVANSLEANISYTSALIRLTNMTNSPRVRYDSTEVDVARAIDWWKNLGKKRVNDR